MIAQTFVLYLYVGMEAYYEREILNTQNFHSQVQLCFNNAVTLHISQFLLCEDPTSEFTKHNSSTIIQYM